MGEIECNVEKRVVKTVFYEVENKPKFHLMKKNKKVQLLSQRRISCSKIYVFFSLLSPLFSIPGERCIPERCSSLGTTYHYISIQYLRPMCTSIIYYILYNRGVFEIAASQGKEEEKKHNQFLTPTTTPSRPAVREEKEIWSERGADRDICRVATGCPSLVLMHIYTYIFYYNTH